jgi:hypothetical protein
MYELKSRDTEFLFLFSLSLSLSLWFLFLLRVQMQTEESDSLPVNSRPTRTALSPFHGCTVQDCLVVLRFADIAVFFNKLKLCGNPVSTKSIGAICPTVTCSFRVFV